MKKKRVLILPGLQKLDRILEDQDIKNEYDFVNVSYKSVEIIFEENKVQILCNGESIDEYDYIWLTSNWTTRDVSYAISLYLKEKNIPFTPVEKNTSKISDQMIFSLSNIQTPKTYFAISSTNEYNTEDIMNNLQLPIIIKDTKGACGKNLYFANSKEELKKIILELPLGKNFYFQEFIQNDYDWGVLISHNEIVSAEKKYATDDIFRNNIALGGEEEFIDIDKVPTNISEMAFTSMNILDLDWGRPDIIIDKATSKPYLLEVNRHPGITADSTDIDAGLNHLASIIDEIK